MVITISIRVETREGNKYEKRKSEEGARTQKEGKERDPEKRKEGSGVKRGIGTVKHTGKGWEGETEKKRGERRMKRKVRERAR